MTVTLELPPEIEAGLLATAQAQGLPVSEYLQKLVREQVAPTSGTDTSHRDTTKQPAHQRPLQEWLGEFQAWAHSHDGNSLVLPDEAMEREAIYGERGL